jgi:threonine synthase
MFYESTRNNSLQLNSCEAMLRGLAPDGGLFIPRAIPELFKSGAKWQGLDYIGRAKELLSHYLTDFTSDELDKAVRAAYSSGKFDTPKIAPVVNLDKNTSVLELWHGPTCAFKDLALQLFPHLLTTAMNKANNGKRMLILVATSGDTGKAALEGFRDVDGIDIAVFYPESGTSALQRLQMITQEGNNVHVYGVSGNFDDAQRGVKALMSDKELVEFVDAKGINFSSANSINWGRLVPQIVYYLSAYCDMVENGTIHWGEMINITVPTGNFGNILAAYIAKQSGLPIDKLICASNANNVLTDFIKSGNYNRNRFFHKTFSPSMDILVSSNLERLLYMLANRNSSKVNRMMADLNENGFYTVDNDIFTSLRSSFQGGFATDEETLIAIKDTYEKYGYLTDPHTAVAFKVADEYRAATCDNAPMLIASTASPFKFPTTVAQAIIPNAKGSDFQLNKLISAQTGMPIPAALSELESKAVRHDTVCTPSELHSAVVNIVENK